MRIDIWTDIICPWCGLGHHALREAIERFDGEVELVHRSFLLDPSAKAGGETMPARQMLRRKGLTDGQINDVVARVEGMATALGLAPYIVGDNVVGSTALAHELGAWAAEQGQADAVWGALYRAYFAEARSIFDVDSLVALVRELGLDAASAREALDTRMYAPKVQADQAAAHALGVTGVPFILVDGRYGVSGAQPADNLLRVLERAASERAALTFADGTTCGPDGCA